MAFDVEKIREDFPILSRVLPNGNRLTYLDNGATSQKPEVVIERLNRFFREENANIHRGLHYLSAEATSNYENARNSISEYLQTPEDSELIFTRGTTEAINLVTHGFSGEIKEGDEIVITLMEHHANFVPWQILAQKTGAKIRYVTVKDNGELDMEDWEAAFTEKTRIAAFTHVSNALGTINPVAEMTAFARERGVLTLIDGAQSVPHGPVNLQALGGDFFVFSGHKVFGPDGIGVLVGNRDILNRFPPYQSGGDMIDKVAVEGTTFREAPEKFEAGTPNISAVIGLAATFEYLSGLDWDGVRKHEQSLLQETTERLKSAGGVRILGEAPGKASVISFLMDDAHPQDIATILDNVGVAIRTGHHCAQPLMTHFGITGTARASFAFYNNRDDVDALMAGIEKVKRIFS
ncbi:MAG: SufS family cysteine desulfurase [Verrucomicrobiales bacterium]|nr:SufS family cysteine desulfurase [Verrucomicrobiales bacterium]